MVKVRWSDLPEELVDLIANRLSSNIELLRIRSICKPWRSTVATNKCFPNRFQRNLPPFKKKKNVVSPNTFSRLTLPSSCPNKGWLIKTRQVSESSKSNLLSPLSCQLVPPSHQTLDLLKFGVSEIRQSYSHTLYHPNRISHNSSRTLLEDNLFFEVDCHKQIWCCKTGEESSPWTRIKNEEAEYFSDIILHRGQIYALDLKGAIWWISVTKLNIFQYTRSTPIHYYDEIDSCKDKRLVEYGGELCIVQRFCKRSRIKRADIERTVDFKVYKMDKELVKWVEVNSLGDKTLIVATDSCFTVLASEYYGCLENAIYFTDDDHGYKFRNGMKGEGEKC